MPVTVKHALSMTTPVDTRFENRPSDWNSVHNVTFDPAPSELIKWISAGSISASSGTVAFANSNGVTWGMDGSGNITASVEAAGAFGGLSAGIAEATSGTVSFANSNGVSWGLNGQTLTATVKTDYQSSGPYLTTAALSQDSSKYAGTNFAGTNISGTMNTAGLSLSVAPAAATSLSFANSNGVSFGVNGSTLTATVQTNYLTTARASTDAVGLNTAQTNVTWTVNSSGLSLNASGYAGIGTSATNASVTLNTNGIAISIAAAAAATSLSFANSNGVSWGINASTITATVKTDYQTSGAYLTTAALSQDSSKYAGVGFTSTTIAGTAIVGTHNTAGLSLGVPAFLTTAQSAGAYLTTAALSQDSSKYAGINGAITGGSITVNTSGVSVNLPAYLTTARASTDGLGLATAGTNVTWTANSAGVSIDAGGYAGTGFATTTTNGSVIVGTQASNGETLAVPAFRTEAPVTISSYQDAPGMIINTNFSPGSAASLGVAFQLPQYGSFSLIRLIATMATGSTTIATTASSANASAAQYSTFNAVVYSLATGANSTLLSSVASGSAGYTDLNSISVAANGTQYTVTLSYAYAAGGNSTNAITTQYAISNTNYSLTTNIIGTVASGARFLDIPFANSLTPGPYWLIVGFSTSSAANSTLFSALTARSNGFGGISAGSNLNVSIRPFNAAGGTSNQLGQGVFSTAAGGTTGNLPLSAISTTNSNPRFFFQMLRSG